MIRSKLKLWSTISWSLQWPLPRSIHVDMSSNLLPYGNGLLLFHERPLTSSLLSPRIALRILHSSHTQYNNGLIKRLFSQHTRSPAQQSGNPADEPLPTYFQPQAEGNKNTSALLDEARREGERRSRKLFRYASRIFWLLFAIGFFSEESWQQLPKEKKVEKLQAQIQKKEKALEGSDPNRRWSPLVAEVIAWPKACVELGRIFCRLYLTQKQTSSMSHVEDLFMTRSKLQTILNSSIKIDIVKACHELSKITGKDYTKEVVADLQKYDRYLLEGRLQDFQSGIVELYERETGQAKEEGKAGRKARKSQGRHRLGL